MVVSSTARGRALSLSKTGLYHHSFCDHSRLHLTRLHLTPCLTLSQFPQTFLTSPSKLRNQPCKIPTVITETLMV